QFSIPDDNWYVTTPQVDARGPIFMQRRMASTVSTKLVQGAYSRKSEIESQVIQAAPALAHKLEEQLDQKLSETRRISSWPMPASQPPFKIWPDRLRVDGSGLALVLGITVGRPALDERTDPVRRVERKLVKLEDMPQGRGLQFGISGAFL